MPNIRNTTLGEVKTALSNILIANGYNTDVKTVSRLPKTLGSMNDTELPAFFVTDVGIESPVDISNSASIIHTLVIEIIGYFRDRTANVSENYNKLISDIWKMIYAPITFTAADHLTVMGLETLAESPFESGLGADIIFRVQIAVDYWFNKSNP